MLQRRTRAVVVATELVVVVVVRAVVVVTALIVIVTHACMLRWWPRNLSSLSLLRMHAVVVGYGTRRHRHTCVRACCSSGHGTHRRAPRTCMHAVVVATALVVVIACACLRTLCGGGHTTSCWCWCCACCGSSCSGIGSIQVLFARSTAAAAPILQEAES